MALLDGAKIVFSAQTALEKPIATARKGREECDFARTLDWDNVCYRSKETTQPPQEL